MKDEDMTQINRSVGESADKSLHAQVHYTIPIDADDIIRGFRCDDERIFMFIMAILEDDRVGIELRERLLEELTAGPDGKEG